MVTNTSSPSWRQPLGLVGRRLSRHGAFMMLSAVVCLALLPLFASYGQVPIGAVRAVIALALTGASLMCVGEAVAPRALAEPTRAGRERRPPVRT